MPAFAASLGVDQAHPPVSTLKLGRSLKATSTTHCYTQEAWINIGQYKTKKCNVYGKCCLGRARCGQIRSVSGPYVARREREGGDRTIQWPLTVHKRPKIDLQGRAQDLREEKEGAEEEASPLVAWHAETRRREQRGVDANPGKKPLECVRSLIA